MATSFDTIKIRLIQARNTADMEAQERACFLERMGLQPEQLVTANISRDTIHDGLLDGFDALMIGGAGEYSVTKDYPWMPALLQLVRTAHARSLPTFGSCWGHQLIARALGGKVVRDDSLAEFGCGEVLLTEDGATDPLLLDFPRRFNANMGHHDRVAVLPPGGVELARSASQGNEAFRIADKPIYGTQFHSELDEHRERERLLYYRDYYRQNLTEEEFQAVLDGLRPTTEVDRLLRDFLARYVVSN